MEKNCRRARDLYRQGMKTCGHLVVFQGAPGAGKMALLSHFKEAWHGKLECPLVLQIGLETLEDTSAAAWEIVKKIAPGKEELFRQQLWPTLGFSVLEKLLPPKRWWQPLCILADEIQNVTERHGTSLLTLHLGEHGLPIVTVAAGRLTLPRSCNKLCRRA